MNTPNDPYHYFLGKDRPPNVKRKDCEIKCPIHQWEQCVTVGWNYADNNLEFRILKSKLHAPDSVGVEEVQHIHGGKPFDISTDLPPQGSVEAAEKLHQIMERAGCKNWTLCDVSDRRLVVKLNQRVAALESQLKEREADLLELGHEAYGMPVKSTRIAELESQLALAKSTIEDQYGVSNPHADKTL